MPTFQYCSIIAVVNKSTIVTDTQGIQMVAALNQLLPKFCNDWKITRFVLTYVARGSKVIPANSYLVYLLDTSDVAGAMAYHDITSAVPYGKVFAKTVLQNGGVMLYEPTLKKSTVAQALAHEVFELIIDPRCNLWWMNYNTGTLFAGEVSDPVQSNVVVVNLSATVKVGLSDWVLPAWQDVQNTTGPFNHLNTLKAPLTIDKYGYALTIKNSTVSTVYGALIQPNQKEAAALSTASRLAMITNMPS